MTVKPAQVAARNSGKQDIHYIRKTVNFNDPNISDATKSDPIGCIPKGSYITGISVEVVTVFNAGTTNVLTFGTTTANANEIAGSGDINEASATVQAVTTGLGRSLAAAADVNVYAKYTQTGTAATTGQAVVVISYAPNNDG